MYTEDISLCGGTWISAGLDEVVLVVIMGKPDDLILTLSLTPRANRKALRLLTGTHAGSTPAGETICP